MTCHDARALFSARADDALAPDEAAPLAAHLEACPECRAEWARFEGTVSLVQAVEPARAPAGFVDRVLERTRPVPWYGRLVTGLFMPLRIKLPIEAAAIVLVAGLAVLIFERSPEMRQAARSEQAPPSEKALPPERSADDAMRKPGESKESEARTAVPQPRAKVAEEQRAARAEQDSSATAPAAPPASPTPPPAAREPLPSARPDAGATSAPPQRAETTQRAAGLTAAVVRARLVADDPSAALVALAEAVSRAGGTEVARRAEADGSVVDATIPRESYAAFLRELHRLGAVTIEQPPTEPSPTVSVTIRITR
jgi:hypothetical protein